MVKKVLLLAVLALALPLAAFASGAVDFTNTGGTLTGSSAGLSLSGSALTVVNGLNGGGVITSSNLGSVSFTTGAFTSGNAQTGGTLAAGGSFTIVGNGVNGVPTGTIFSGTFTSATWEMITLANGNHEYALIGAIAGTLGNFSTNGATSQLTVVVDTHKGYFNGSASLASGDTSVSVPEPGTLSLLGTGLIGLAGVLRRKLNLV
jgi:PEP-CTERM motif-containing protein